MPISTPFIAAAGVAIATMMSLSTARAQAAAGDEGVFVDLQSHDASVRIDMVMGDGTTSPMCSVPCRKALPRAALYVIRSDELPTTSPFLLPSDRSDLTLSVRPGSRSGRIAGMSLTAAGAVAMVVGFMFSPADNFDDKSGHPPPAWPAILDLGGIVVGTVGAIIWWRSEPRVSSSSGRTFSEAPRAPRKRPALAFTARGLEF
jgi:hypothetical protein